MKYNILLMAMGFALFSCKSESPNAKVGDKTLKYLEVLDLSGGSLTFTEVEDSRCPEDVQCVRAGEVIVTLQARDLGTVSDDQIVKMCLGDCLSLKPKGGFREADTARFSLDGNRYQVILTEVNPYPGTIKSVLKKDYNIKLSVESNP